MNDKRPSLVRRLLKRLFLVLLALALLSALPVLSLRWLDPPASAFMLQRAAAARINGEKPFNLRFQWRDFERISPELALAVIASEDQRFLSHWGFDFQSIRSALETHQSGGRLRGASTLSQQLAKNLFLWPGRSWLRKGLEAWFTVLLELCLDKRRILELYLNVAELDDRVYGAQAAARHHFGVDADKLSSRQAALLAALLPNPRGYSIAPPSPQVQERADWIGDQVRRLGGQRLLDRL